MLELKQTSAAMIYLLEMQTKMNFINSEYQTIIVPTSRGTGKMECFSRIIDCSHEGRFCIGANTTINRSEFGPYLAIGCYSYVANSKMGSYCSIGSRVSVGPMNYELTRPILNAHVNTNLRPQIGEALPDEFIPNQINKYRFPRVTLGSDIWIGDNSVVLSNTIIGNGSVIGAGSVVTKNVAPYSIVAGNPAKVIRYRFSKDIIDRLEQTKWWEREVKNLPEDNIYDNVDRFLEYFENT